MHRAGRVSREGTTIIPRRKLLNLIAGAATLPTLPHIARADSYPVRPVRIVVGFAAGGPSDMIARLIGRWLSERLGQQVIIENRAGAASNIATEAVARAPADGHTLLLITSVNTINATFYENLKFDFLRDIDPIAGIMRTPHVMEVAPSLPARTIPDFIAYARDNPGKLNFGSGGNGTVVHMSGEMFKMMTGIDMVHVPYRGAGPALSDLLAGRLQVMFDAMSSSIGHIRAGKLRPLGVTSAMRSKALPDIPAVAEFVPGYETSTFFGIGAPKGTPREIIDRLNKEINAGLAGQSMIARLDDMGANAIMRSPDDFGKLISEEIQKWGMVIKFLSRTRN